MGDIVQTDDVTVLANWW